VEIKNICGYPHIEYPHGYENGYGADIYLASRVWGSYYSYPTHFVDILNRIVVRLGTSWCIHEHPFSKSASSTLLWVLMQPCIELLNACHVCLGASQQLRTNYVLDPSIW